MKSKRRRLFTKPRSISTAAQTCRMCLTCTVPYLTPSEIAVASHSTQEAGSIPGQFWTENRPTPLGSLWFSSVPPGKCSDNTLKYSHVTTVSATFCSNPWFTLIQSRFAIRFWVAERLYKINNHLQFSLYYKVVLKHKSWKLSRRVTFSAST
jgi:hypothetical protein